MQFSLRSSHSGILARGNATSFINQYKLTLTSLQLQSTFGNFDIPTIITNWASKSSQVKLVALWTTSRM